MSQADTKMIQVTPEVDRLAARQLGLVAVRQLYQVGLSRRQVARRVTNGSLNPVRRGVYRVASAPLSWEQAVLAAALVAGDDATISHATAAALWDLRHSDRTRAGLHVTTNRQLRIDGIVGHLHPLSAGERTTYRGIPVTTPERTLVDVAAVLTPGDLGQCVDDAIRRQLIGLDRLRRVLGDAHPTGGRHRIGAIHQVLAERGGVFRSADSDWELEMDRQWDRLDLPPARRQYRVSAFGRTYRLDRAIPELKIGIEWNGYQTHGTRSGFDRDSDRLADLAALGWHVIAFTSKSTPERITRAVLRVVEDRRHRTENPVATAP